MRCADGVVGNHTAKISRLQGNGGLVLESVRGVRTCLSGEKSLVAPKLFQYPELDSNQHARRHSCLKTVFHLATRVGVAPRAGLEPARPNGHMAPTMPVPNFTRAVCKKGVCDTLFCTPLGLEPRTSRHARCSNQPS